MSRQPITPRRSELAPSSASAHPFALGIDRPRRIDVVIDYFGADNAQRPARRLAARAEPSAPSPSRPRPLPRTLRGIFGSAANSAVRR